METGGLMDQDNRAELLGRVEAEVRAAECAFSSAFANRDRELFLSFVSENAVFLGEATTHRGRQAVALAWASLLEGVEAPFTWMPERVEAANSGLVLSTGPVHDARGCMTGRFSSVWRREEDGAWRVIFDQGCALSHPTQQGETP